MGKTLTVGQFAGDPLHTITDDYLVWIVTRNNHRDKRLALKALRERDKEYMLPGPVKKRRRSPRLE